MSLDDVFRAFALANCPIPVPCAMPHGCAAGTHGTETEGQQDRAGPAHEVETLLCALAEAGRDLGPELAHHLRETLAPMSQQVRTELLAVIDDSFEVAPDVGVGNHFEDAEVAGMFDKLLISLVPPSGLEPETFPLGADSGKGRAHDVRSP